MRVLLALGLALALGTVGVGCKKEDRIIEKVTVRPSENLETIRVALVFGKKVQLDLASGFALKDYGYLFVNAYTANQPFELGFDLNTAIANDQEYVQLEPTTVFPNGVPMGLPHAVVEVKAPSPAHPKFDIYGYVDVLHQSWLGTAAVFNVGAAQQYFPPGLSLSQVFLRDDEGNPGVIASVFGPEVDSQGVVIRNGGIALLANVRQLLDHGAEPQTLYPEQN